MSENTQEAVIKPEYIIEDLLEQNKVLVQAKAYQGAINRQLQEESKSFLNLAAQYEEENGELKAKNLELVKRLELLENQLEPITIKSKRNKKDVIEAEIVEAN